jgi:enoyl-CoA hydratase/carnithine racemase
MDYEAMKSEVRDNVAWITFNRPEAFNAINSQATNEFYDIVNRCSVVMEMYLTNRVLTAQEALDWGLVNRVVPAADLMTEVTKLATQLAKGPTQAYGGVKKLVMMAPNDTLESQMEREARLIAEMSRTKDGREGIKAFVEKRKPNFVGE